MGPFSWCQDCWQMMQRTKPQYLPVLGRKRSSLRSPEELLMDDRTCLKSCVGVVVMLSSVCYGLVLLVVPDSSTLTAQTMSVPLVIAATVSITGGLCLSEYISTLSQEVPSFYSCCYQHSSEILAFFVGWSWLLSQAAMSAAICSVSYSCVSRWTGDVTRELLEKWLDGYADALPSAAFALVLSVFVVSGVSGTLVWYVLLTPLTFVLLLSSFTIIRLSNKEEFFLNGEDWLRLQSLDEILRISSICILFFSGAQSLLRVSQSNVRRKTKAVTGPLNFICFVIVLGILLMSPRGGELFRVNPATEPAVALVVNILLLVSLCVLGLESFRSLHCVIEDMASDGLLFRTFAKKWKPFCLPVPSGGVHVVSATGVCLLVTFMRLQQLLMAAVVFPLIVNSLVPFLVLVQRYKDTTSWQYEPMLQTTARPLRDHSKGKILESQYSNGVGFDHNEEIDMSTTCIDEDSEESTDDIDSVVQQYRDQAKIANMPVTQEHDPAKDSVPEPTPGSSFRATLAICAIFLVNCTSSISLSIANLDDRFVFFTVALLCMLLSTVFQGLLVCLPQNGAPSGVCCTKVPRMPWVPGLASWINMCLLMHCFKLVWEIYLGWFSMGLLVYFSYGIRSSTAANSFHNPTHIKLRPIPSYGNKCVPQVVPSQRRRSRQLSYIRRKTSAA